MLGREYHTPSGMGRALVTIDKMVRGRFQVLCFGDSIVWGQGLREEDKFTTGIVQWINEFHPELRAFKTVKAHSGAMIGAGDITDDPKWPGEIPVRYPTIQHQAADYEDTDPNDVDLIILNGGINDIGISKVFDPKTSGQDLRSHVRYAFGTLLRDLLLAVAARYCNPRTKILVLGYYPVLSRQSKVTGIIPMLTAFGIANGSPSWNPWRNVVDNALLFESYSDEMAQQAILAANAVHPGRFVWVKAAIGPQNAAFAPKPWIFGVRLPYITAEDDLAGERALQSLVQPNLDARAFCLRASAGHPNRWGARAYLNAIYPIVQREYNL